MRPRGRVALLRDHMESRHLGGALGQRASRPLRPTWGKRRLAAFTGGSRCCATAWKAAILAALQPPTDHHRISQSPPGRDGVPPPSGGARRPAEPPGRVTRPA
ncbi:MAG: hypothetical protein IJL17_04335 [Kiritimatiellae bacterium]|nr:hypothetical protein [Kiritimatiellia bacterium]